jgi:hypothetical protein
METKDEKKFLPEFLESCTDLELVVMQHELKKFPEDKKYRDQILKELGRRQKKNGH